MVADVQAPTRVVSKPTSPEEASKLRSSPDSLRDAPHLDGENFLAAGDELRDLTVKETTYLRVEATVGKEARVDELIVKWTLYRNGESEPQRYSLLSRDLYNARNEVDVAPPYPGELFDADAEIMASVEHYFLCRGWVGNGEFPASEVVWLIAAYDIGKLLGVTPRHNKDKPVTPASMMQLSYQNKGLNAGIRDAKQFRVDTPILWKMPPKYF